MYVDVEEVLLDLSQVFIYFSFVCADLPQHRACGGMGILVKEKFDPERPPETNASFSLRNPDEVQSFLSTLVSFATAAAAKAPAVGATS